MRNSLESIALRAQRIMDEAHKTCPYSKALRADTSVKLTVDQVANQ
jgi:organic hydroperoxide reductase OsmC/OhrA